MLDLICILFGYLLGSINPAYFLSKSKDVDLRKEGTGNLGTTNTVMVLGKKCGIVVFVIDFLKGLLSYNLSLYVFKRTKVISLLVGAFAIIGHIYPFYLKFKGGKGLLTFIGLMFGYNPLICLIVFILSGLITIIINYSVAMPYSISLLFFIFLTIETKNIYISLICLMITLIIQLKHLENYKDAKNKEDMKVRDYLKKFVFKNDNFLFKDREK